MPNTLESAPPPAPAPAPALADAALAAADLRVWREHHLSNTAISRDTPTYNRISALIADTLTALDGFTE